jgi:hypothetical protein
MLCPYLVLMLWISEFKNLVCNFFMLPTMNNNGSKNSLASGRILNL